MNFLVKTLIIIAAGAILQSSAETLRCRALWIHDGDTVTVTANDGRWYKVRLFGIDAPEADQPGGNEATRELIRLIGRRTVTVTVKDQDRYGRIVGVINYRDTDINREMLTRGHAWYYQRYAPDQDEYTDAERLAREEKSGLWKSESSPIPPWVWRKMKRKAGHGL